MWAETPGWVREVSLELGVWRGGLLKGVGEGSPWSYRVMLHVGWAPRHEGSGGAGPPAGLQLPSAEAGSASASPPPPECLPFSATNVSLLTSYLLLLHNPPQTLPHVKAPWDLPVQAWGTHPQTQPGRGRELGGWEGFGRVGWGQKSGRKTKYRWVTAPVRTAELGWAGARAELSKVAGEWLDLQLDGQWDMGSYGRA